jgi:hypothetical protein
MLRRVFAFSALLAVAIWIGPYAFAAYLLARG